MTKWQNRPELAVTMSQPCYWSSPRQPETAPVIDTVTGPEGGKTGAFGPLWFVERQEGLDPLPRPQPVDRAKSLSQGFRISLISAAHCCRPRFDHRLVLLRRIGRRASVDALAVVKRSFETAQVNAQQR